MELTLSIEINQIDKLLIFSDTPRPFLAWSERVREREREREQEEHQFSENQPGVSTVSTTASVQLLPREELWLLRMNQSDFYKMQKLNFHREKHRGYWNIGQIWDGTGTGTQHRSGLGSWSWYLLSTPLLLFKKYKISLHLEMSGQIWQWFPCN